MIVGSHAVSHRLLSTLPVSEQEHEITDSFSFLESLTEKSEYRTFCYPYGEAHSFTQETEALLTKHKVRYSFTVDPRIVEKADLARPQALPRFDCNMFPFGKVRTA
jgi:peptidoglycan/xylan/chitin deacetylase (PgdA/CDA1 family)